MAFQTRKSQMAIVEETTQGTAVEPSSGSDGYVALQEGFTVEAAFEELENAELTSSLGPAKTLTGFETPTASLSHYLRSSGSEATAPNFDLLIEMAFGSAVSIAAAEYDTVGGSTAGSASARGTVVVDAGEGATFERGEALLIKDAANGYSIRNVFSVSTDTLNLGFNLSAAPASGVNLGRAVLYKPSNSHKSATIWDYRANGAANQVVYGSLCSEMSVEVTAGEMVNAAFSFQGLGSGFNAPLVDSGEASIEFVDDAGTQSTTITQKLYKTPKDLLDTVVAAMDGASTNTITGSYNNSTGKYTLTSDGTTFSLNCATANSVFVKMGFGSSNLTLSTSYTAASAIPFVASPFTPSFDSQNPFVAKNNEALLGSGTDGYNDFACLDVRTFTMTLSNEISQVLSTCAESGVSETLVTAREVTVDLVADVPQYDAKKFEAWRNNDDATFCYNFGQKSGGNWIAGKSANIYLPTASFTAHSLGDEGGLVTLAISLKAYVDSSGNGEVYLNFL